MVRRVEVTTVSPEDGQPGTNQIAAATPMRSDIQGLRAVAVLAVLGFHLWPEVIGGGYVGVDVFFVISGFLITSHLLRNPPSSPTDFAKFWARRIRRLIPAASLVLFCTLVASAIWLPVTMRDQVAREVAASAMYFQNWRLATTSTDYLGAAGPASPVQHYWSLSIEEQFYLGWPVFVSVLALVARWRPASQRFRYEQSSRMKPPLSRWLPRVVRHVPLVGISAVVAISLWWSATLTATDPSRAYFVTTTRIWELAAGGLLAAIGNGVVHKIPTLLRATVAWIGLGLIAYAVVTFNQDTVFPGTAAVVPVGGTMAVIAASVDGLRFGPGRLLGLRPVVWTGDISYSIYLWHWPLVVITPFVIGADLTQVHKIAIFGATFVLADTSTRLVENPMRRLRSDARMWPTYGYLVLSVAVVVASSAWLVQAATDRARSDEQLALSLLALERPCVGAEAARNSACSFPGKALFTPATFAREDKPILYDDGCWNNAPFTGRRSCHYGPAEPSLRVALVGNSHAGHWQPAISAVIEKHEWSLTTFLASECYTVDIEVDMSTEAATTNCASWNEWAISEVSQGEFDLVIMSNRTFRQLVGVERAKRDELAQAAYRRVLSRITASGARVLILRDTPAAAVNIPDCLAQFPHNPSSCSTKLAAGLEADPLADAARTHPSGLVEVLEVTSLLCRDGTCPPIIGGVIVYFDHGHMTATFAATLQPEVEAAIARALNRGR